MAKLTKDDLVSAIESMTLVELSDLVSTIEEKFGVSASSIPTASAAAPVAAAPTEEKTSFDVELTESGTGKIAVIKAVREINNTLGLVEAKTLVESAPKIILQGVKKDAAEEAKKKLEAAGAKVTLK